jgi:hypothetical protein
VRVHSGHIVLYWRVVACVEVNVSDVAVCNKGQGEQAVCNG